MSNLAYGTFTITNLSVVTSVDVYYYNSTSSTSLVGGEWSTNTPTWTDGKYIWSKTITTWEQGVTTQSQPVCITGQKGSTGSAGQSVTKITQQYALSTSNQTAPTTGWSNTMPTFQTGKYYWTRSEIVWANPTSTTYTTAVLANGITSANATAATANQTANTANQTANTANQTANTANQTAQNAVSIANGKNTIYYSNSKPTGGTYKAGDTWFNLTTDGYKLYEYDTTANDWVQKSMDGKSITAGTITAAEIQAGAITSGKLATDSIQSRNYVAGTGGIYSADGTFLDLANGNIYSPNFGVNNTIDNIDNGAYIRGSVYANDGTIGSDANNYWYIGNYYDYNQGQSAMLRSHGTAAIQLGDSNTWRVATDRIHTAWNDDSTSGQAFRLHYPSYGGKYWDSGLHVPTSATDKLLYIRNASTSTSLENLQNDINDTSGGHYWNYQFYLTSNGSLYAKNIYIMDDNGNTTQIGGTDGVYLLKSGGTITGDLQVNQVIKNSSGSAITLQTNLGSTTVGTLTGNSTNPINIGVTGTLPVANGGTGNVNYTSGGVVYVSNTNPKTLLSNAAGTSGHLLASGGSGAPTWVNPGTLTVAAATKATQDGDGNVIKTTYLKLNGGNVTGPVSFGDSVSIDDLNAGTLVVTGNASFVNNINVDSINGVQVGETPKFTDTVTTITTTGSGNAITSITASNGVLTATKGSTFLTGITSSQVTTALGYTPYNATNPNGYTNNTGTVTSVQVQASSPLQSSINTAQNSSLNTTISFVNQNANVILAGPSSGNAAAPAFRALVAADIPTLTKSKISDFPTTWALSSVSGADDLKAIEALTGTSGFLKKTAANTWSLDTSTYLTSHQTVTNKGATLSWGASTTVATIGSTNINVSLPANPNSHYTANLIIGASNSAKANAAATNGNVFLNLVENDTVRNYHNLKGGNGLSVTSDANGVVTFTSPAAFTGVNFNDGTLTFTKSDGNTATLTTDSFVITQAAGATGLVDSGGTGLNVGGATTKPVYFSNGIPVEVTSIPYTLLSGAPSSMTPASHTHGNIQNGGTLQTTDITIGNGDKLIVTDASDSNKIARTSISFDGSTATKALTQKGTWEAFNNYSLPLAANGTRGGVQIGYTENNKKYAVKLDNEKMYVEVPWSNTTYSAGTGLSLSGTTFNHSNSVTAGTVGTSSVTSGATLAIPYLTYDAQGHITGSGTHTHTINNIFQASVVWGGDALSGTATPNEVATIDDLAHNKFAFMSAASVEVHYSRDDGSTWIAYGNDTEHRKLVTLSSGFRIGGPEAGTAATVNDQLRIQLNANIAGGNIYCNLRRILVYLSTGGSGGATCTVQYKTIANYNNNADVWATAGTYNVSGWSGWNSIPFANAFGGGSTQTGQIAQIRLIFKVTSINSNHTNLEVYALRGIGFPLWQSPSTMASTGHLYTFDIDQNATFPAQITATQFNGNLNGLATKATGDKNGADITTTYLKLAGGTMTGVLTAKGNLYEDSYSGALNMNNSNIYGLNSIYTSDTSDTSQEGIHFYRDTTHVDSIYAKSGVLYFTPNRPLGEVGTSYSIYHTGNKPSKSDVGLSNVENTALSTWAGSSNLTTTKVGTLAAAATKGVVTTLDTSVNLPTAGAVSTAISNAITNALSTVSNNYVTLTTEQTVSGRKTFSNLAAVTFKPSSGTDKCNINYDSTLGALVFSF